MINCGVVLVFFLTSCASYNYNRRLSYILHNQNYVTVYQCLETPEMFPTYLIMKRRDKICDLYFAWANGGIIGQYQETGDTITLIPEYEYTSKTLQKIPAGNKNKKIPYVFLRRGKNLLEITDFSSSPILFDLGERVYELIE